MLWLSKEAIEYAVAKCRRERGYKIGIALNSRRKHNEVEMYLHCCLRDTDEFKIRRSICNTVIEFHNGSYIRIIPASENTRGHKMHLLIADEDISDEVINCVLRPCEILESLERQRRRNTENLRPVEPIGLWTQEFINIGYDEDFVEVSEEEFMNILNIPNPQ